MVEKTLIGVTEKIIIIGKEKEKKLIARIDTGATRSSVDEKLASELKLGPTTGTKLVKSAHGSRIRPVVNCEVILAERKLKGEFTLADRSHMMYQILIGRDILTKGFLIDPNKNV